MLKDGLSARRSALQRELVGVVALSLVVLGVLLYLGCGIYLSVRNSVASFQQGAQRLAAGDDRPPLEGLMLVRRVTLPWESIRRVRVWREGATVLFFHPRYWQVLAMRCPLADLPPAEEYVRKKLKRFKRVKVLPPLPRKQRKSAQPRASKEEMPHADTQV